MMLETGYETGSDPGSGLTQYMGRDGHDLRDASGRELDDDEIEQFNEQCAQNGFSRQIVLAPERTDLDEQELDQAARATMNELTEGDNTSEYVYSIHEDTDHPHVHVAATATQDSGEMWLDRDDLDELRDEIAADHFRDHSTDRQQEIMKEQDRDDELQQEQREKELADLDEQEPDVAALLGSPGDDGQEQGQDNDDTLDAATIAASAAEVASLTEPMTIPLSAAAEAYRERQHEKELERQREHQRDRR